MMTIKKKTNSETKTFWDSTKDAREKVEQWPSWKRNLKVTQYSVGFDSKSSETSASDSCGCAKDK
ncbi:MAG: hypothetical protein JRF31_03400 [Deltaproteobacteria bacterium]|nr:hypothetical protein [Deltaproteobacteria bacterium]MBW2319894.1 hypothetical protein [Deltaproteobacteria bacterium]